MTETMTHSRRQIVVLIAGMALALALALGGPYAASGDAREGGNQNLVAREGASLPPAGAEPGTTLGLLDKDAEGNEYVAGELMVSFASDAAQKAAKTGAAAAAGVAETYDEIDAQLLVFRDVKGLASSGEREQRLEAVKEKISALPGVESVSYNYVTRQYWAPNDYHWWSKPGNYGGQYQLRTVHAHEGWNYPRGRGAYPGGAGVRIAILDSGYDRAHYEFGGKVVAQWDFLRGDGYANDEQTDYGHGTRVASVAAARTNNRDGIAGAAPDAKLLIAKISDKWGGSTTATSTKAVLWAVRNGARVINISSGGGQYDPAYRRALDYAFYKRKVLPICAGGNSGQRTVGPYPARYGSCMAVGSSTGATRSSFSSHGAYIDVVAPGEKLLSAQPLSAGAPLAFSTGTSFSAPVVSGLAADIVSRDPSLTGPKIKAVIERNADDLGSAGEDPYFGRGRVNFKRAIANAPLW